jgi:hypothetical protein
MILSGGGSIPLTHRLSMKINESLRFKEITQRWVSEAEPSVALVTYCDQFPDLPKFSTS